MRRSTRALLPWSRRRSRIFPCQWVRSSSDQRAKNALDSGEGGIRTLERACAPYSLSRRVPSATRPPLRALGPIVVLTGGGAASLVLVSGRSHAQLEAIFEEVEAPFAFVDLDAMWANSDAMLARAGEKPIRVASKSLRCRALLERILARDDRYAGLMTFTLPETLWLAEVGFENLLLAYPTTDADALSELALRSVANPAGAPIVMVDCVEHLELIGSVLGPGA